MEEASMERGRRMKKGRMDGRNKDGKERRRGEKQ
jgi:hypothetical protein